MRVCGFTFVRNAVKLGYPIKESILSILPLCDHFIIIHGNSDDSTEDLLRTIDSDKIEIFKSVWDDSLREGGKVLAIETNKALDMISVDYDWAFYIQADEVVHEKYYAEIKNQMQRYKSDPRTEGLLFKYTHFFGTPEFVADSRMWYRNEIRIIRPDTAIRSYRDAQGFRKNNQKLHVRKIDAYIYHYGWVKDPRLMKAKEKVFNKLWHDDEWMKKNIIEEEFFDFNRIDSIKPFNGRHPAIMKDYLGAINTNIKLDPTIKKLNFSKRILHWFEELTGIRLFEYKNYTLIK